MINTLIFDLGKVILNFDYMTSCRKFARFSEYSAEEIFKRIYQTDSIKSYDKGQITSKEFYQEAGKAIRSKISYEKFSEIFADIFIENKQITKLIKNLSPHYTLVLLSNTNELHFQHIIKKFPKQVNFNFYILSYKEGVTKPDKRIFQTAVDAAGVKSHNCLYIDDFENMTNAGQAFGFNVIQYHPEMNLEEKLESKGIILSESTK